MNRHMNQRNRLESTNIYGNAMSDKVDISDHWTKIGPK